MSRRYATAAIVHLEPGRVSRNAILARRQLGELVGDARQRLGERADPGLDLPQLVVDRPELAPVGVDHPAQRLDLAAERDDLARDGGDARVPVRLVVRHRTRPPPTRPADP